MDGRMIGRIFAWIGDLIAETIWVFLAVTTFLAFFPIDAQGAEFLGADVGVYVGGEHITHEQDAVQLGLSLEWEHFDFSVSHGIKRTKWRTVDEDSWQMNEWQSGSITSLVWYPLNTTYIRPMLLWSHSSDIARGRPFNSKDEPSSDFLGLGVAFEEDRLEIDFAVGYAARECDIFDCYSGSGTIEAMVRIRGYIWR